MEGMERVDAYTVLGLPDRAPTADVVKAYRKLARKHHPDMGGDEEQWFRLQRAYISLASIDDAALPPDPGMDPGPVGRAREAWRGWPRMTRVGWIAAAGVVGIPLVAWWLFSTPVVSWQAPAAITAYLAGWWLWSMVREARTPIMVRVTHATVFFTDAADGARVAEAMGRHDEPPGRP